VIAVPDVADRPLFELLALDGRVAVVTGGGRGIGAATVRRLAEAGAQVLVADIDIESALVVAEKAAAESGQQCAAIGVDLTDADDIRRMVSAAVDRFGRIDILVNNAGSYPITPLAELTDDQWDKIIALNLRAVLISCREVAATMIDQGRRGVIISVSSTAGFRAGGRGKSHYVATKHGVRGLTKALAVELGPHGIRVLDVAPTLTDTPGISEVLGAIGDGSAADRLDQVGHNLPLGRAAVPDDIARAITFCASDLALMITGITLPVDGGHLAT
jgi:NAD(P)-dependent dehydrogenase (short-subunit alcohol dehydrogenase family)